MQGGNAEAQRHGGAKENLGLKTHFLSILISLRLCVFAPLSFRLNGKRI